jgi:hypothetical protein
LQKKLDVNLIFGENCMILKNFSSEKQSKYHPCYRRKKSPALIPLGDATIAVVDL